MYTWLLLLSFICAVTATAWPDVINYNHPNNWAESASYSKSVDSFITGAGPNVPYHLIQVNGKGKVTQYAPDARFAGNDIFTQGTKVDDVRKRVYFVVANMTIVFGSAPTPGKLQSAFAEADLNTGEILNYVDLSDIAPIVSANDVVRHPDGYFFITDLFGRLLKIDANGKASVFSEDRRLQRVSLSGVNGIVILDRFNLLVGNFDESTLLKVNIITKRVVKVPVLGGIVNPDGIVFGPNGDLFVAQNIQGANSTTIARLRSRDRWLTARKIDEATSNHGGGSAVIFREDAAYVTHTTYPPINTGFFDQVHFRHL